MVNIDELIKKAQQIDVDWLEAKEQEQLARHHETSMQNQSTAAWRAVAKALGELDAFELGTGTNSHDPVLKLKERRNGPPKPKR